jgi:hypothetical protein
MPRAATSPAPTRRTPSRERKSPARLGLNDSWGPGATSKWVSVDNDTKDKIETEKVAKREKAVAAQNKEDAKKKATFTVDSTGLKSKKYPMSAASLQGGILAAFGVVIVSMIEVTPQDAEKVATTAVFAMLVAPLLVRYLAFVNKTKLVKKNKVLDSAAKAVVDQLSLAPLLVVLSLVYLKLAQARPAAARTHAHAQRVRSRAEPPVCKCSPPDPCGVVRHRTAWVPTSSAPRRTTSCRATSEPPPSRLPWPSPTSTW